MFWAKGYYVNTVGGNETKIRKYIQEQEVILLADWDTVKTNKFASRAIAYLLNCENEKLPKEIMVAFE